MPLDRLDNQSREPLLEHDIPPSNPSDWGGRIVRAFRGIGDFFKHVWENLMGKISRVSEQRFSETDSSTSASDLSIDELEQEDMKEAERQAALNERWGVRGSPVRGQGSSDGDTVDKTLGKLLKGDSPDREGDLIDHPTPEDDEKDIFSRDVYDPDKKNRL
jgi:hypothetical protein